MRSVKCLDISQVPVPAIEETPQLVWVATGELYLDAVISGEVARIKISDIRPVSNLPANPSTSALYRTADAFKFYTEAGWQTIATAADVELLTDKVAQVCDDLYGTSEGSTGAIGILDRLATVETALDGVVEQLERI